MVKWLSVRILLCALLCSSLVTYHSSPLLGQQPQTHDVTGTEPLYPVNAQWTNGMAPGYWATAGSGLTLNLSAGTANCSGIVTYAGGTLTMTASATNYVYLNTSSSCAPGSNTTGWGNNIPIATVVTGASSITSITDNRTPFTPSAENLSWNAVAPTKVVYASKSGCALNSNIVTGGGTDDTACLDGVLASLYSNGGGELDIDGVALISSVLVTSTHTSALQMGSNTTIRGINGGGLFLKAGSNCLMLGNHITGNPSGTFDTNMVVRDLVLNGNAANQSLYEQNLSSNLLLYGMWFGGFNGLVLDHVTMQDAETIAFYLSNGSDFLLSNDRAVWTSVGAVRSQGGIEMSGPLNQGTIFKFRSNGGDDSIAFNANETFAFTYGMQNWSGQLQTPPSPAASILPWAIGRLGTSGTSTITNITVNGAFFDNAWNGIRIFGYLGYNPVVDNIVLHDISGNLTNIEMQNYDTSLERLTISGWHVTGYNTIVLDSATPASFDVRLSDISAGVPIVFNSGANNVGGDYGVTTLASPYTLSAPAGANNNIPVGAASLLVLNGATGAFSITGFSQASFANAVVNRQLTIADASTYCMTIRNQNSGSSSGNQILTTAGGDVTVCPNATTGGATATFWYDGLTSPPIWVLASTNPPYTSASVLSEAKTQGTMPTCAVVGFGTTEPTCQFATGSNDNAGWMYGEAGTGSLSSGTFSLTFSTHFWTNYPVCTFSLADSATGTWDARATAIAAPPSGGAAAVNWDNNGVALSNGAYYIVNYHCFGI